MISRYRTIFQYSKSYAHGASNNPLVYRTVGEHLRDIAEKYPNSLALASFYQGQEFTYEEFYKKCETLAAAFINLGLQKHDRIGIYSPNNYEWVLTQFAASMADLILVNINPAYQVVELEYALNKVQCKALVTVEQFKQSNYVDMLGQIEPQILQVNPGELHSRKLPHLKHLIKITPGKQQGFHQFHDLFHRPGSDDFKELHQRQNAMSPDEITNIQFTSGTTGLPKGASLSHFNIINNGRYIGERLMYTEKDRVCIPVPLYHCFGMVLGNLACISYGSSMIYPSEGFNAQAALETITKYKCTSLYGVPTMFIEYLKEYDKNKSKYNLDSLRTGIIAGSLAPVKLMKEIMGTLNMKDITNCYGMTETSPVSTQTKITDTFEQKTTTVGCVSPHLEIKIVDKRGNIVPRGESGEYCIRGYSVMKKYWDDPEQTKATFDRDGFLCSGDIATMDEEGYVSIVGRKKDMIIRGGENISPKEIEEYLLQMPGVEGVQVVGCADAKFGEEIVALIKMKQGHPEIKRSDIFEFCNKKIAHFKIPKYAKFVEDFPYTVTAKPQKYKMREDINRELQDKEKELQYRVKPQ